MLTSPSPLSGVLCAGFLSMKGSLICLLCHPPAYSEDELRELFGRSGPLARLVLPPSHALALVEYCEPQDARTAFKASVVLNA